MKNGQRTFLFLFGLLWIACAALLASAQQGNIPITKKRVDTTIVDRNQRQREVQVTDKSKVNTEPAIHANEVRVRIRYRKEYGFVTTRWIDTDRPYSCHAFSVDGSVWVGEQGTFGRPKTGNEFDVLMTVAQPDLMREEGSYYVCGFTIQAVPLNELLIVKASMAGDSKMLTSRWRGGRAGSQPQPPPGSERIILNGSSKVRLTRSDPTAIVDFEMVYRPIQLPPR